MQSLLFWAIGWIGFVLLAADAFKPAKQPAKRAPRYHHWLASNRMPAPRKQRVRSDFGHHMCYVPA